MTARGYDVIIIGGGIIGTACARELSKKGLSVVIIEKKLIGGGATAAGMGHVVIMDNSDAQMQLTSFSQRLWYELRENLPRQGAFDPCGTIWVAADEDEMKEVEKKHFFYKKFGIQTEILSSQSLEKKEPHLRPGLKGGLLVPSDFVVYPPVIAHYFMEQAAINRSSVLKGVEVISIENDQVHLDNQSTLRADIIINAAGCESTKLDPDLKIKSRKGHMLITDRYPGFINHQLVELGYLKSAHSMDKESVAFNVQPRKTGQVLLGSSRQFDDESNQINSSMISRIIDRAQTFLPGIEELSVLRCWTGFRAATSDGLPLIGRAPKEDGHFLATGHEGLGITTSLATARLLTDTILGRKSEISRTPYLPDRGTL